MNSTNAPQIVQHINDSVTFTAWTARWWNGPQLVAGGQKPSGGGIICLKELNKNSLRNLHTVECEEGIRCSSLVCEKLAIGTFKGSIEIRDACLEECWRVEVSKSACINSITTASGLGAAEVATGNSEGDVHVWDPRQRDPVLTLQPAIVGGKKVDCWAVAFGNSYNELERCLCAGYDNGDIKMFDMRKSCLIWEKNMGNGVVCVSFDRADIEMNKLAVGTLEAQLAVFDLRTHHASHGFAGVYEKVYGTVWRTDFLPQNREVLAVCGGTGQMKLFKYHYPDKRCLDDEHGLPYGVPGSLEVLNEATVSSQPITSLDWHPKKLGLACMTSLDQTVKVVVVTRLNLCC